MVQPKDTPWTNQSSDDRVMHALLHIFKAAGKIASILEAEGHGTPTKEPRSPFEPMYLADLVISAIRIADLRGHDLKMAVTNCQIRKNDTAS